MLISYNWLSEYVEHGLMAHELAAALTMSGLEVEGVEARGDAGVEVPAGVVVGHVLETRAHPNADRLTLCTVDVGAEAPSPIVCGAANVAAGQKVAVATVGTTLVLPGRDGARVPVLLDRRKIRGEVSEGMICAEDELGLSDDHSGILVLDDAAIVGTPLADYLAARAGPGGAVERDWILDVNLTPNRPDAVSHIGVARDVAALTGRPLRRPDVAVPDAGGEAAARVSVEIEAPELCGRYAAVLVEGVRVGPSPAWLRARLEAVGLRSVNNVVDVTNFVMHEVGQPLHAFDFDRIADGRIVVREAELGEAFTTLDGKARALPAGALLICDAEKPIAVAGVMGGADSEVTDDTVSVLLESAYFDPSATRRTARALGLSTDASYRFERGVDPLGQPWAAARAAALIAEVAGGRVVPGMAEAVATPHAPRTVTLRLARLDALLGAHIPPADVRRLLTAIGFEIETDGTLEALAEGLMAGHRVDAAAEPDVLRVRVPSFRPDVAREVDVIEEVARLWGVDRLPEPKTVRIPPTPPVAEGPWTRRTALRAHLAGAGYRELYVNSLMPGARADAFRLDHAAFARGAVVHTLNPISLDLAALRPSLLPGALAAVAYNQRQGQRGLRFFEVGHVFREAEGDTPEAGTEPLVPGYDEREHAVVIVAGEAAPASWDAPARAFDLYDIRGTLESLLAAVGAEATFEPDDVPGGLVADALTVTIGGAPVGLAGRIVDAALRSDDVRGPVFFAELDWGRISAGAGASGAHRYAPFSRFPTPERDLAFVLPRTAEVGRVLATIREAGAPLLHDARVFDLYEGERIGADRKSAAFALRFGADRTLRDAEVDEAVGRIRSAVEHAHGGTLRA